MSSQYSLHVISLNDIRWDSKLHSKLPDLYVLVKLGDVSKQTHVVKKNLTPSWDETLTLSSDPEAGLTIELRHKSSWKSDPCIGYANIRLDELLDMRTESEASCPARLFLRKKGSGAPAGTLHLRLETANLMSNAELDVKAASSAVRPLAGATITALADGISQLGTENDLYKSVGTLLSKLDAFVEVIDEISKIHPYLTVTWHVTSVLFKGISNQFKADQKIIGLVLLVSEAFNFVRDTDSLPDKSKNLEETIINLLKQTTECCLFVKEYVNHGFAGRMLNTGSITKVDEFSDSVTALKNALDSNISLHTAFISARILDKVDDMQLRLHLNPDKMNAFNRPLCLPGTRMAIQKQIIDWMVSDSSQNIFWLYGVAGSGKSTISTTVAEHFRGLHRLGAFLFFERGKSDPTSVIRTLAYGLARADSNIAKHIAAAINLDNDVASASASSQFEALILKPLAASAADLRGPMLVVLDAIDECGTFDSRRTLMELFHQELHKLPKNVRILITSRRETDIEEVLSTQPDSVREVELDYTSKDSHRDVLEYIRGEMTRWVKDKVLIPEDWPWELNMKLLAKAAAGLFIWASTAVKLVSLHRDDPFQKLEDLISDLRLLSGFGLDDLYTSVLRNSGISWDSEVSRTRFSQVLGLILLSKTPLSISTIDAILGFPPRKSSKLVLSRLQCLLAYPSDASDTPVHLFHTSFSDYLMSPVRSTDPWHIEIAAQMTIITTRCFGVMKDMLHFNMCNLESSFVPNGLVQGLNNRIVENIPAHLAYACLYWSHHLSGSSQSSLLLCELSELAYDRLLYWFEVLSLLKKVSMGDAALLYALQWTGPSIEGLSRFLIDARKLLMMFSFPISQSTPHIYMSMLPLMAKESLLAAHYSKCTASLVSVERRGERGSIPLLRLFHTEIASDNLDACAIAISLDCTRIAFGLSAGDIYICDSETGEMVLGPLKGHTDYVSSIAFSPDSTRIVSGSGDRTIRSWSATSGESTSNPFENHTGSITSVVFSPDGVRIASGSQDRAIIIWDAWRGTIISGPLQRHAAAVTSVDFSPDGVHVVSGSGDSTLILWDIESEQALLSFDWYASWYNCVKFSPDGSYIASGSDEGMVSVWNTLTGERVCAFGTIDSSVNYLNFSRDGSRIVFSGCWNESIRLGNIESGNEASRELTGHAGSVKSAIFSPDGTRIMSGSRMGEIGIWDVAETEAASGSLEWESGNILLVAYTSDGNHIVSASQNMVRIRDVQNGAIVFKPFSIHCATLSPDNTCLALSYGGMARICDTESGDTTLEFDQGPMAVSSMCFSRNGTQLVSCSGYKTIKIWDVESGEMLYGPYDSDRSIMSVAFSPDGKSILSIPLSGGPISVCDVGSGNTLGSLFGDQTEGASTLSFSPCFTRLASGFRDGSITIWDYESRKVIATLFGHTGPVYTISFSSNGLCIASGSQDKTVRVWDVVSGKLILSPFTGHSENINCLAFSPDGMNVASGSNDRMIRVWDITTKKTTSRLSKKQEKDGSSVPSLPDLTNSVNWVLDEDGWVRSADDELLLWVPPTLRNTLWHAQNIAVFGGDFQTRLDFSTCLQGEHWQECFMS